MGVLVNALFFFAVLAVLFLGMVTMQIAGHHYGLRRERRLGRQLRGDGGRRGDALRAARPAGGLHLLRRGHAPRRAAEAHHRGDATPSARRTCASICSARRTTAAAARRDARATSTRGWRTTTSSSTSRRRSAERRPLRPAPAADLDPRGGGQRQGPGLAGGSAGPAEPQRDVRRGDRALRGAADARAPGDLRPPGGDGARLRLLRRDRDVEATVTRAICT